MGGVVSEKITLLTKGIIATFEAALDDLQKVCLVSQLIVMYDSENSEVSENRKKVFETFSKLHENCTKEKMGSFFSNLRSEFMEEKLDEHNGSAEYYCYLRKLKNLLEKRLAIPLRQWKEILKDEKDFQGEYSRMNQELKNLKTAVETARTEKDKIITEQAVAGEQLRAKIIAPKDFKSQHPIFLRANTEEYLKGLEKSCENRLESLQVKLEEAKNNLKGAEEKLRTEKKKLAEETLKTKEFIEWLMNKDNTRLEEFKNEFDDLWQKFSNEMEESRQLCQLYKEAKDKCDSIFKEKQEAERRRREEAAAIKIQAIWRGTMVRKKMQESSLNV